MFEYTKRRVENSRRFLVAVGMGGGMGELFFWRVRGMTGGGGAWEETGAARRIFSILFLE